MTNQLVLSLSLCFPTDGCKRLLPAISSSREPRESFGLPEEWSRHQYLQSGEPTHVNPQEQEPHFHFVVVFFFNLLQSQWSWSLQRSWSDTPTWISLSICPVANVENVFLYSGQIILEVVRFDCSYGRGVALWTWTEISDWYWADTNPSGWFPITLIICYGKCWPYNLLP